MSKEPKVQEKENKEVNANDYPDYGDYLKAKKEQEQK